MGKMILFFRPSPSLVRIIAKTRTCGFARFARDSERAAFFPVMLLRWTQSAVLHNMVFLHDSRGTKAMEAELVAEHEGEDCHIPPKPAPTSTTAEVRGGRAKRRWPTGGGTTRATTFNGRHAGVSGLAAHTEPLL